jgi:hypothetical protein
MGYLEKIDGVIRHVRFLNIVSEQFLIEGVLLVVEVQFEEFNAFICLLMYIRFLIINLEQEGLD